MTGKRVSKKVQTLLATILMVVSTLLQPFTLAYASSSSSGTTEMTGNFSIYRSAGAASLYINTMIRTGNADGVGEGSTDKLNVGNVSAAVGYVDVDEIEDLTGFKYPLSGIAEAAKNREDYDFGIETNDGTGSEFSTKVEQELRNYVVFGNVMKGMGLDDTAIGSTLSNPMRTMQGFALQALYYLATGTETVMKFSIQALQATNPFGLFLNLAAPGSLAGSGNNLWDTSEGQITGYSEGDNSSLDGKNVFTADFDAGGNKEAKDAVSNFRSMYAEVYYGLYSISSMVLLPLLFAVAWVSWLFMKAGFRNIDGNTKLKRYIYRLVFLVGGIPILGTLYTVTLNKTVDTFNNKGSLTNEVDNTTWNADDLMLSILVDFKAWAQGYGLALPEGVTIKSHGNSVDYETYKDLRKITYKINKLTHGSVMTTGKVDVDIENNNFIAVTLEQLTARKVSDVAAENKAGTSAVIKKSTLVRQLLSSYSSGETYEGTDYESYVVNMLRAGATKAGNGDAKQNALAVNEWLTATADPAVYAESFADILKSASETELKDTGVFLGGNPMRANSAATNEELGKLYDALKKVSKDTSSQEFQDAVKAIFEKEQDADDAATSNDNNEIDLATAVGTASSQYVPFGQGTLTCEGDSNSRTFKSTGKMGLTPIGMYNYLNSEFTNSGVRVYSLPKSVNGQSHVAHYSVNLVGGGIISPLLWLNTVMLLAALSIIAVAYGFMMMFSNLKRAFHLIITAPIAVAGNLRSIARVLLLGLAMIVEIFMTFFAYQLVYDMLMVFDGFGRSFGSQTPTKGVIGTVAESLNLTDMLGNSAGFLITLIMTTLMYILFIIVALRLRAVLTSAVDEFISAIIERVFGVSGGDASGTNMDSVIMKGIAGGVALGGGGAVAGAAAGALGLGGTAGAVGALGAQQANARDADIENADIDNDTSLAEAGLTADGASDDDMMASIYISDSGIEGDVRQETGQMSDYEDTGSVWAASANVSNVVAGGMAGQGGSSGAAGMAGAAGSGGEATADATGYGIGGAAGLSGNGYGEGGNGYGYGYGEGNSSSSSDSSAAARGIQGSNTAAIAGMSAGDAYGSNSMYSETGSVRGGAVGYGLGGQAGASGVGGQGGNATATSNGSGSTRGLVGMTTAELNGAISGNVSGSIAGGATGNLQTDLGAYQAAGNSAFAESEGSAAYADGGSGSTRDVHGSMGTASANAQAMMANSVKGNMSAAEAAAMAESGSVRGVNGQSGLGQGGLGIGGQAGQSGTGYGGQAGQGGRGGADAYSVSESQGGEAMLDESSLESSGSVDRRDVKVPGLSDTLAGQNSNIAMNAGDAWSTQNVDAAGNLNLGGGTTSIGANNSGAVTPNAENQLRVAKAMSSSVPGAAGAPGVSTAGTAGAAGSAYSQGGQGGQSSSAGDRRDVSGSFSGTFNGTSRSNMPDVNIGTAYSQHGNVGSAHSDHSSSASSEAKEVKAGQMALNGNGSSSSGSGSGHSNIGTAEALRGIHGSQTAGPSSDGSGHSIESGRNMATTSVSGNVTGTVNGTPGASGAAGAGGVGGASGRGGYGGNGGSNQRTIRGQSVNGHPTSGSTSGRRPGISDSSRASQQRYDRISGMGGEGKPTHTVSAIGTGTGITGSGRSQGSAPGSGRSHENRRKRNTMNNGRDRRSSLESALKETSSGTVPSGRKDVAPFEFGGAPSSDLRDA